LHSGSIVLIIADYKTIAPFHRWTISPFQSPYTLLNTLATLYKPIHSLALRTHEVKEPLFESLNVPCNKEKVSSRPSKRNPLRVHSSHTTKKTLCENLKLATQVCLEDLRRMQGSNHIPGMSMIVSRPMKWAVRVDL
jgi:hypothetical protein